jgi:hypothetical protein
MSYLIEKVFHMNYMMMIIKTIQQVLDIFYQQPMDRSKFLFRSFVPTP